MDAHIEFDDEWSRQDLEDVVFASSIYLILIEPDDESSRPRLEVER